MAKLTSEWPSSDLIVLRSAEISAYLASKAAQSALVEVTSLHTAMYLDFIVALSLDWFDSVNLACGAKSRKDNNAQCFL